MKHDAVLVTGVGRRLGLHMARTFLSRGIPVIGTYLTQRNALKELEEQGAQLIRCDLQADGDIESLIGELLGGVSSLRAIVHNASDWLPESGSVDPQALFERMMRIHAGAPYLINLALADLLQSCTDTCADIIHVGDYVSCKGSRKHIAYAASKAAQDNLTFSFSALLAPKVKVNSIAPALMLFNEGDDENYRARALDKSLMKREGGADELQRAVDYLMASNYITGRVLPLDGGRHLR